MSQGLRRQRVAAEAADVFVEPLRNGVASGGISVGAAGHMPNPRS